jgi:hypothetical protein
MHPFRQVIATLVRFTAAVVLCGSMSAVQAGEYCCTCKGQTAGKTIDAGNRAQAIGQCSLECGGFTNVGSGKCAVPPPAAATATPAAAPPASAAPANVVFAYKSEDCSGDPQSVTGSTARLQGIRSFHVDSGNPASAWEKPDYAGLHTEFVGPSICVSPGFEIQSIKRK